MGAGLKIAAAALLAAAFIVSARAADPPALYQIPKACAPTDSHTTCALEVMRNNALNELAVTIGQKLAAFDKIEDLDRYWADYLVGLKRHRAAVASYWLNYVNGLDAVSPLTRRDIGRVCAWRGTQTEDEAKMCRDWRSHEWAWRKRITPQPWHPPGR